MKIFEYTLVKGTPIYYYGDGSTSICTPGQVLPYKTPLQKYVANTLFHAVRKIVSPDSE